MGLSASSFFKKICLHQKTQCWLNALDKIGCFYDPSRAFQLVNLARYLYRIVPFDWNVLSTETTITPSNHWHGCRKGGMGVFAPLDFENFSKKKIVFLVSSRKKQISLLLASPKKFWKNYPNGPPLEKIRRP